MDTAVTAELWWRYQRLRRGERSDRVDLERGCYPQLDAAVEEVSEVIDAGESAALVLLQALVAGANDRSDLALVGAGPLEDFLCSHGDRFASSCVETARRSPDFAAALAAVWLPDGALGPDAIRLLGPWLTSSAPSG